MVEPRFGNETKNREGNAMQSRTSGESRKEFLLEQFKKAAAKSSNVEEYQFWRHDNKPIELWSNKVIWEKISYVHNNPVEAGLVYRAQDYVYSSAADYTNEKGLLDDILVFRYYG